MHVDGILSHRSKGIPDKGKLLTKISLFWFEKLIHIIPNHFVTADIDEMPDEIRQYKDLLAGRAMLVRKAQVIPLEAIVRGYLTGTYTVIDDFRGNHPVTKIRMLQVLFATTK
jgi:phosphoribosylaminoimidazole-succinocarboxamide synthase